MKSDKGQIQQTERIESEKVYSTNNEEFYSYEEVIEQLSNDYFSGEKVEIYEGTSKDYTHSDFFDVYKIVSLAQDRAYDEAGDSAEDYLDDFTAKKIEKLKKLILNFMNKNLKQPKFCSVENIKKITITIE